MGKALEWNRELDSAWTERSSTSGAPFCLTCRAEVSVKRMGTIQILSVARCHVIHCAVTPQ